MGQCPEINPAIHNDRVRGALLTLTLTELGGSLPPFRPAKEPFRIVPKADIPLDFISTASIGVVTESRPV